MDNPDLRELQEEIQSLKAELTELKRGHAGPWQGTLARLSSSPRLRVMLVAAVVGLAAVSYAAQISVPNTFVNGTVADANEVNANFSALVVESNAQDLRIAALEGQVATNTSGISTNTSGIATNTFDIGTLQTDVTTNTSDIVTNTSDISSNDTDIAANTTATETNTTGITTLNTTFAGVGRNGSLLTFSGMNVQVVSGSGTTYALPNGLGNLIVGYNENTVSATRTGSHNIVVGLNHEYTSYGGLVAGVENTIHGNSSTVSGGYGNTAAGSYSSVSGGYSNWAGNVCIGGSNPGAHCVYGSGCTGGGVCATNSYQSVAGGSQNEASGTSANVSGGSDNKASNHGANVSGGYDNTASGQTASVSGGIGATAGGTNDWAAGGVILVDELLTFSGMNVQVVDGSGDTDGTVNGLGNLIVGYNENTFSAPRTGSHNFVVGTNHGYTSYAGFVAGHENTISGPGTSVSGGIYNTASGTRSSVSGGMYNESTGNAASISGGYENEATGSFSSVSGGEENAASAQRSSICGGRYGSADSDYSVVIGGNGSDTSGADDMAPLLANHLPCATQVGDEVYFEGCNVSIRDGTGNTEGVPSGLGNLIVGYNENTVSATRDGSHNLVVGIDHEYRRYGGFVAGHENTISGDFASVSGGSGNTASDSYDSVGGGVGNTASGGESSVSGGASNEASGWRSTVSGGAGNIAAGAYSSVSGGTDNTASNLSDSVVGDETKVYVDSYQVH